MSNSVGAGSAPVCACASASNSDSWLSAAAVAFDLLRELTPSATGMRRKTAGASLSSAFLTESRWASASRVPVAARTASLSRLQAHCPIAMPAAPSRVIVPISVLAKLGAESARYSSLVAPAGSLARMSARSILIDPFSRSVANPAFGIGSPLITFPPCRTPAAFSQPPISVSFPSACRSSAPYPSRSTRRASIASARTPMAASPRSLARCTSCPISPRLRPSSHSRRCRT